MQIIKKYLAAGLIVLASIHASGVVLNEIRTDQPDYPDDEEYVELKGEPGESLDGVWFLYIGDHSGDGSSKGSGVVELALNLTGYSIPDDGHFLMVGPLFDGESFGLTIDDVDYLFEGFGSALENSDNVTPMLVRNFTGNGGNEILGIDDQLGDAAVDIDDNDDGTPNATLPWDEVIDAVGLVEGPPPEFYYGAAFGFSDVDPVDGAFVAAHAYRTSDTEEWFAGEYTLYEEDENGGIIGLNPDAVDTPGTINPAAPAATYEPSIDTVSAIFANVGDTITLTGENLELATAVKIGPSLDAPFGINGTDLEVTIPDGATNGHIEVTNPDGISTTVNLIVIGDFSGAVVQEDFTDGLGDFNTYSVASTANWESSTYRDTASIEINGYGADVASDDWLISPAVDLSDVSGAYLQFGHERAYGGPDLEVMISSDYAGSGDPGAATWTFLDPILAGESSSEVTDSGKVDLSAYEGETVYISFRYTSDGTGPGDGAIDRIHYFVVAGESLGWKLTDNFGWLFYETADWAISAELGSIYVGSFPWIYQVNFGYLYHVAYADGLGFWLYAPELEWIFAAQGSDGWFMASGKDWAWDNFKDPQQ